MDVIEAFDRPIAFHRIFFNLTGSVHAALFLSQAFYWSKRTKDPDGWFYKTRKEWEEETCLSRNNQETVRKLLISLGFLEERLRGAPAQLYFRVNTVSIFEHIEGRPTPLTLESVLDLFDSKLCTLSRAGYARAVKLACPADMVAYSDVLRRDGMVCFICKESIVYGPGKADNSLSFDHSIPLMRGGTHTAENIRPAHMGCNRSKSDAETDESSVGLPSTNKGVDGQPSVGLPSTNWKVDGQPALTESTSETTPKTSTTPVESMAEEFARVYPSTEAGSETFNEKVAAFIRTVRRTRNGQGTAEDRAEHILKRATAYARSKYVLTCDPRFIPLCRNWLLNKQYEKSEDSWDKVAQRTSNFRSNFVSEREQMSRIMQ